MIFTAAMQIPGSRAESTGWIDGHAALALVKSLGGKQLIPTKVSCCTTAAKDATSAFQGKIDYGPNTSNTAWYAGGYSQPAFYVLNKKLAAKGYRLVSDNNYRRAKSGMIVHCSIWHKN